MSGLVVERAPEATRYVRVRNVRVPTLVYGTAWKEDETARLATMAPDARFRGVDTANKRRQWTEAGKTRLLGVSNVNLGQLDELYAGATTKPAIVQNRCFAAMGWDRAVRQFCIERDILYQGFSLLTANREVLSDRRVHEIALRTGRTVPQVIFRFALQVGMSALTGTTSATHMREDLGVYDFELQPDEVRTLDGIGA